MRDVHAERERKTRRSTEDPGAADLLYTAHLCRISNDIFPKTNMTLTHQYEVC